MTTKPTWNIPPKPAPKPAAVAPKPAGKPVWPTQAQRDAFYGNPRGKNPTKASAAWEKANLVRIKPPFKMYYDGQPVSSFLIHKKCADSLLRVFNAIWIAAGKKQAVVDQWGVSIFGGAYNYRLTRGGNTLSSHSWACAIDLDPANNSLGDSTPKFAGVPAVLKAFADEGWTWGGRWSRPDAMHWQAASV